MSTIKNPIILIHGAGSGPAAFQSYVNRFDAQTIYLYSWDVFGQSLQDTASDFMEAYHRLSNVHIIGHSLGGVIGKYVANVLGDRVSTVTTISSPFGGCDIDPLTRMMYSFTHFTDNVAGSNQITERASMFDCLARVHQVVTVNGWCPLLAGKNDGFVTVESQQYVLFEPDWYTEADVDHFSVLHNYKAFKDVELFLQQSESIT